MTSTSSTSPLRHSRTRHLAIAAVVALGACSGGEESGAGNENPDPAALLQDGVDAHLAGDLDKAQQHYQQLVEVEPDSAVGFYNLGVVAHNESNLEQAEENYRKAFDLDPNLAPAAFNLAILRTEAEAYDEAVELYQRVNELQPENAGSHLNLGLLLQQLGRTDEADVEIDLAAQLDPALAPQLGSEAGEATDAASEG